MFGEIAFFGDQELAGFYEHFCFREGGRRHIHTANVNAEIISALSVWRSNLNSFHQIQHLISLPASQPALKQTIARMWNQSDQQGQVLLTNCEKAKRKRCQKIVQVIKVGQIVSGESQNPAAYSAGIHKEKCSIKTKVPIFLFSREIFFMPIQYLCQEVTF